MTKGMEETPGRHRCELLQPLYDHHLAVADVDPPNEDVETIHDEGGIEVGKLRDRGKVFQG